jgi:hypothetical protein
MFNIIFSSFLLSSTILHGSYLTDGKKALLDNNIDGSIKLFKLSARAGEDEANFQLGKIYYLPKYHKRNLSKAYEYFKKASDYEHVKAKYNLAVIYGQKKFKKHSYTRSYELFHDLAKQDYSNAQYKLGIYLLYGFGIEKNYGMAKDWLERSYFENKYERASCGLAVIYANGFGVIQNLGRARQLSGGNIKNYSLCKKVFNEFKLYKNKYKEDKGFKYGYYK